MKIKVEVVGNASGIIAGAVVGAKQGEAIGNRKGISDVSDVHREKHGLLKR